MNQKSVSILAVLINIGLTVGKVIIGLIFNLTALMAEGIHSGLDIISSVVAYFGIKSAQKPVDETHPYGYYRAESLAGLIVIILLAGSAIWILFEGISGLFSHDEPILSIWALVIMAASAVVNEIMARLKFKIGQKYASAALVADGEHSRADVIASIGVLIGIVLIRFWATADAIIAILIGLYILWEAWLLGRKMTDSLLDVADLEIEARIKEICEAQSIGVSDIKSRKMGPVTLADLKIKLDPKIKIAEAAKITKDLELKLLQGINELKSINIAVESHEFSRGTIRTFGGRLNYKKGFEPIELEKLGYRIIIPLSYGASTEFGAPEFLVIDRDDAGETKQKTKVKNKFYEDGAGHGVKFAKAVSADEVWAEHIGENAQKNLKAAGVKFEIKSSENIKDLI